MEGLRSNWIHGTLLLRWRPRPRTSAGNGRHHDRAMVIGGDKFSGKSGDWADVKTKIISATEASGYSYITKMGAILCHFAGSGDHNHIEDDDLEKHFEKKMWPTQLRSIRSLVTKSTLHAKCEEYLKFTDDEKTDLRDWKVVEWFKQSNSRVVKALRDQLLTKKEKGGSKSAQLRQLFVTSQMTSIIDGDHEDVDLDMAAHVWDMPVVKLWADILALLEAKGRSGSSNFWIMMCTAVKSVNPNKKGQPGDFALARNELQNAWQGLAKIYENDTSPLEALIDWLQAEQHLEMMRLLASHPQEGTAWENAYKKFIARSPRRRGWRIDSSLHGKIRYGSHEPACAACAWGRSA